MKMTLIPTQDPPTKREVFYRALIKDKTGTDVVTSIRYSSEVSARAVYSDVHIYAILKF